MTLDNAENSARNETYDCRRAYLVAIEACANYEVALARVREQKRRLMIYCAVYCLALTVAAVWGWAT